MFFLLLFFIEMFHLAAFLYSVHLQNKSQNNLWIHCAGTLNMPLCLALKNTKLIHTNELLRDIVYQRKAVTYLQRKYIHCAHNNKHNGCDMKTLTHRIRPNCQDNHKLQKSIFVLNTSQLVMEVNKKLPISPKTVNTTASYCLKLNGTHHFLHVWELRQREQLNQMPSMNCVKWRLVICR